MVEDIEEFDKGTLEAGGGTRDGRRYRGVRQGDPRGR
jgi:hypothetical protein